ncbi:MAG: SpoIID/LytB domain-containing protein [Candidatus Eremiobacteraeota bacterium]|nr:SpoIID/LytB domain-containing protein [Candidatus Eremiobacteraeota bacterium]
MIRRRAFLFGTLAAASLSGVPALATGGLDDPSPSPSPGGPFPQPNSNVQPIRVLLGRGIASQIDDQSFTFGSRSYRGTFSTTSDGQIINTVPLESYLYSVVPMESPRTWPDQTLQAQAIVARTFALARSNPKRAYDVVASERDQAYGGLHSEYAESTAAVNATAGQVLRYNGALASVSYMSCCGGHTEDPADAWQGGADLPYLRGVTCTFCTDSPDYRWVRDIPLTSLVNAFSAQMASVGTLQSIGITAADGSGRAKSLRLTGNSGSAEITGADFRRALGPSVVKSLLIRAIRVNSSSADSLAPNPSQAAGTITIEGQGRGHGVGLCQWGSRGLASAGRTAREILSFYFPGIELQ